MKVHLISALALTFASGACLAQAPVVDVNQSNNVVSSGSTLSSNLNASDLETRLAVIERIVESRSDSQQRMQQQLDMLQSDVDTITGSIELHNHQLEKILERQRELFLELDKRFEGLQQQGASVASNINNAGSGSATDNTSAPTVQSSQSEQSAYQDAVNLILKDRDYEKAVPAFRTFLTQYPNSDLSDNAHYWLGQLLYNKQDWDGASEQFSEVVNNFTSSPKRADSLLKLGMIAKNQGNASLAQQYFEQVVAEYPNSTPARLSTEQLANG
jgi:tol-pal system protein YbgF